MGRGTITEAALSDRYSSRGLQQGGEPYLDPDVAAEFIHSCDRAGMAVAGVETFDLVGASPRSRIDLVFDCSEAEANDRDELRKTCNTSALEFVRRLRSMDVVVTVEAMRASEWYGT